MLLKKSPLGSCLNGRHLAILNFLLTLEEELAAIEWFHRWKGELAAEIINNEEVIANVSVTAVGGGRTEFWSHRFTGNNFHNQGWNARALSQEISRLGADKIEKLWRETAKLIREIVETLDPVKNPLKIDALVNP